MNSPDDLSKKEFGVFASEIDLAGKVLGDFKILYKLGKGGMGQVFLAEQLSLKRKIALKILRRDLAEDNDSLQRFKKEAEAIAQVVHPCIVQVYAVGEAAGFHFMALEYVEGRNLREYLSLRGTLDLQSSISILRQVASALQRASELGITHRDIKPENILLTRKGDVKVADFGLARFAASLQPLNLTQTGMTLGTPLYMAPEQVEGKAIDQRTDIYSLGVTAYHMISGQPPYQGENAFEVALKHLKGECVDLARLRPDFPKELCELVQKMMAVDVNARPQSFAEIIHLLMKVCKNANLDLDILASFPSISAIQNKETQSFSDNTEIYTAPFKATVSFLKPKLFIIGCVVVSIGVGLCAGVYQAVINNSPSTLGLLEIDDENLDYGSSEQSLKETSERYLNLNSKYKNTSGGVGVCIDLGLIYLGKHQLEDAEKLYQACIPNSKYKQIGELGLGIVYGLKSESVKSHEYLNKVAPAFALNISNTYPEMRYWIAEAIYFNGKNGQKDAQKFIKLLKDLNKNTKKSAESPMKKGSPPSM